jgi:hypothetical protein
VEEAGTTKAGSLALAVEDTTDSVEMMACSVDNWVAFHSRL